MEVSIQKTLSGLLKFSTQWDEPFQNDSYTNLVAYLPLHLLWFYFAPVDSPKLTFMRVSFVVDLWKSKATHANFSPRFNLCILLLFSLMERKDAFQTCLCIYSTLDSNTSLFVSSSVKARWMEKKTCSVNCLILLKPLNLSMRNWQNSFERIFHTENCSHKNQLFSLQPSFYNICCIFANNLRKFKS